MNKLRVVCTPIGNVEDLSPRAIEALRSSSMILAEDTRHTRPLLDRFGIHAPLVSCHQHNEGERASLVVERLRSGEAVSLVSDAGAPGISDPGGRLVADVVAAGFEVEVFPGPSAVVAALMGAGLIAHRFAFVGFLPKKGRQRKALVENAMREGAALVIYEAANRTEATLADLSALLGARRVVVARELTKRHETFHRGVLGSALTPTFVDKGEVVIVVEGGEELAREDTPEPEEVTVRLRADASLSPKERARRLAAALGISTKEAYALLLDDGPRDTLAADVDTDAEDATDVNEKPRGRPARAATAATTALARVRALLADASSALLEADAAAHVVLGTGTVRIAGDEVVSSEIPGADALLRLLARPSSLPAPVEAGELARALLGALSAADALDDALETLRADDEARSVDDADRLVKT